MNSKDNTDEPLKNFREMLGKMDSTKLANMCTRFVISQLAKKADMALEQNLSKSEVLEIFKDFVDEEANDRGDPLIRAFGHMCASYYLVMQNMGDQISKEELLVKLGEMRLAGNSTIKSNRDGKIVLPH
jgi:hypothetical protein